MKKLIAYYGDSPVYVEGFSEDCARSCKGSVHVLPRKPVTVTDDEYDHIKEKYSWMLPKLKVVAEIGKNVDAGSDKKSEPSSQAKPKDAKEESEKPSDEDGEKDKKKKHKKSNRK